MPTVRASTSGLSSTTRIVGIEGTPIGRALSGNSTHATLRTSAGIPAKVRRLRNDSVTVEKFLRAQKETREPPLAAKATLLSDIAVASTAANSEIACAVR